MNFQEEKLKIPPCLIIPFSNKVVLCFQVAPGRSSVVLQHSGEFDDKCPSGHGMTPVLSASVPRDKGVPSNTATYTELLLGASLRVFHFYPKSA